MLGQYFHTASERENVILKFLTSNLSKEAKFWMATTISFADTIWDQSCVVSFKGD